MDEEVAKSNRIGKIIFWPIIVLITVASLVDTFYPGGMLALSLMGISDNDLDSKIARLEIVSNASVIFMMAFVIFLMIFGIVVSLKRQFPAPGFPLPFDTRVVRGRNALWIGLVLIMLSSIVIYTFGMLFWLDYGPKAI